MYKNMNYKLHLKHTIWTVRTNKQKSKNYLRLIEKKKKNKLKQPLHKKKNEIKKIIWKIFTNKHF